MFRLCVILLVLTEITRGLEGPSYIHRCKLNEPDWNECVFKSANEAIPHIVKGDKEYKIPSLNPLHLPSLEIADNNFAITLKNVQLDGIQDFQLKNIKLDLNDVELQFYGPRINILSDYEIDSKLLILTIKGEGAANLTGVDGQYFFKSKLTTFHKNGEKYYKIINPNLQFKIRQPYFRLDNLFNGDVVLGENVNNFLNENSQEVLKELGKPIAQAVTSVISVIVNNILKKIPEKALFYE